MEKARLLRRLVAAALLAGAAAAPAATQPGLPIPAPASASASMAVVRTASFAKADTILGGQSRLAQLLASQGAAPQPAMLVAPARGVALGRPAHAASPDRPDVFHSVALDIDHSPLDARWARVAAASAGGAAGAYAAGLAGADRLEVLGAVNRYVNGRVAFVDDRVQFGVRDRWSGGAETLARGRGDCEDYAIAKLQMLRRAGFADRDLYLTIVKDLARRQDHAVLVVRAAGRFWVLDNGTDRVLADHEVSDYRPILTFTQGRRFGHGYRRAPQSTPPLVYAAAAPRPAPLAPAAAPVDLPQVAATPVVAEWFAPSLNLGTL